jgi:hypothetical protein
MGNAASAPADRTFVHPYTEYGLKRDHFTSSWLVFPRWILELLSAVLLGQMPSETSAEPVPLTRALHKRAAHASAIPMLHLTVTPRGSAHGG